MVEFAEACATLPETESNKLLHGNPHREPRVVLSRELLESDKVRHPTQRTSCLRRASGSSRKQHAVFTTYRAFFPPQGIYPAAAIGNYAWFRPLGRLYIRMCTATSSTYRVWDTDLLDSELDIETVPRIFPQGHKKITVIRHPKPSPNCIVTARCGRQ